MLEEFVTQPHCTHVFVKVAIKYVYTNEGSEPEVLSRIAQATAALSRLKIIWRDKDISLASKVKLMRMLILSTFLYACESRNRETNPSP